MKILLLLCHTERIYLNSLAPGTNVSVMFEMVTVKYMFLLSEMLVVALRRLGHIFGGCRVCAWGRAVPTTVWVRDFPQAWNYASA